MATKSKPAGKKTAVRKTAAAHHKPAAAKGKVSKEPVKSHAKPAHAHAPTKTTAHPAAAAKPQPKAAATPRTPVESVSLIDKKHPQKKVADGEGRKKKNRAPPRA